MAHDLRSPLTSLKGFSATLVANWERFDDAQRRELVTLIHTDADRMKNVIADVIDLARLEAGRLELMPSRAEASVLVTSALGHLQEGAAPRLEIDLEGSSVWGDLERLATALRHIVDNALRYSEGSVAVRVRRADEGLTIEVSDEGPGLASGDYERAIAGGSRSQDGSRPAYGLRLASALIAMHGGTLEHRSRSEGGTSVLAVLPDRERAR